MYKRIIMTGLCNVCRWKPVCNSKACNDFTKLEDCRCDELHARIKKAIEFAEDIGAREIIDALRGEL